METMSKGSSSEPALCKLQDCRYRMVMRASTGHKKPRQMQSLKSRLWCHLVVRARKPEQRLE